jgi:hypothetical protein
MNRLLTATLTIILLASHSSLAAAADRPSQFKQSEDVVAWLYRDFGWEAIIPYYFEKDSLIDQPLPIYKRYFTSHLAALIVKDREYETRTRGIGNVGFMLIFGSQDPEGISNVRINRNLGTNVVSVLYDQNGEKDVMKLEFETIGTASGWRISNIRYKANQSRAFPNPGPSFSLLEILSRPYSEKSE